MSSVSFALALISLFQASPAPVAQEASTYSQQPSVNPGRNGELPSGSYRLVAPQVQAERQAGRQSSQQRAWLGVSLQDSDGAAEVLEVIDGSPAERARLRAGDRIVSLGGQALAGDGAIGGYQALVAAIQKRTPGARVDLVLERDVEVQLDDDRKDGERFLLGVYIGEPVDSKDADEDEDARPRGAWVTQVTPGYPATRAGLAAGDRLLSIEGEQVEDSEDVIAALAEVDEARNVAVRISRTLQVTLGASPDAPQTQLFERVVPPSPRPPAGTAPAPFERNAELEEELRALSRELRELREQVTRLRAEIDRLRER